MYGIACDDTRAGVLWANWFRDPRVLRDRQRLLAQHFGHDLEWVSPEQLRAQVNTDRYHGALFETDALHFHPLKYAQGLTRAAQERGVQVFAHSPATALQRSGQGWRIDTPNGCIHAQQVVLACGGYLAGLRRAVDASVLPIATYVMVTEPLGPRLDEALRTQAAIYDTRFAFDYYRPLPDTRLLWGGRISVRDRSPSEVKRLLYRDMLKVFPQLEGVGVDYAWSSLMISARHEMPRSSRACGWRKPLAGTRSAPTTMAVSTC